MGNLYSPHRFSERILLFGGGGAGKTNTVLNVASHLGEGEMHVLDADYSMSYDRALSTEFTEAEDIVHVHNVDPDWEPFTEELGKVVADHNTPDTNDWLVVDPISPSWDWVQNWFLETAYGHDLSTHLVKLKHDNKDDLKAYQAALLEDMNWPTVKKEYETRVWKQIQRWKGNLILVAEAKEIGYFDSKDSDAKMLWGSVGFKPTGEGRLKHIAATNLFLDHPKRNTWRMTTVKDRNRAEMDKKIVEDFGLDYLIDVAGWEMRRRSKKARGDK